MSPPDWRPSAPWNNLRVRAQVLAKIRAFFASRDVLEVETPLLAHATVTAPHLSSLCCRYDNETLYLQTSPEYAMKRLVAAGSGAIYQVTKAFRRGEAGRRHNPEFTILEWYRPGFTHHDLMDEMDALLKDVLDASPAERITYRALFERELGIDPMASPLDRLRELAPDVAGLPAADRDVWLDLLLTHRIEPRLGAERPTYVYDYPASQAALARVSGGSAERFEVYFKGVELANGFHELADPEEQRRRFETDREKRRALGLDDVPVDERLLAALAAGLPDCSGVALGVDRLTMLAAGASSIRDVISFPLELA